ncbi:MAG: hypothetical protein IPP29_00855 [Bacteroidetes bacterium]|nr:hypothetical protein [Bacteroidota bacterium]
MEFFYEISKKQPLISLPQSKSELKRSFNEAFAEHMKPWLRKKRIELKWIRGHFCLTELTQTTIVTSLKPQHAFSQVGI